MRQMDRTVMYLAGLIFLLIGVSHAQSLGDVAREQRQNQQAKKDQPAPKVITNEDLPERQAAAGPQKAQSHEPIPHHNPSKSAEQWRKEIEAQEHSIATLQSQMERLNSTIRFAESASFYNSAQHNERQELKQVQVQRMQDQLDEQKKRLDEMQEAARKDGFGNAVYEP
jgi:chaperonin cofactor prefoldin